MLIDFNDDRYNYRPALCLCLYRQTCPINVNWSICTTPTVYYIINQVVERETLALIYEPAGPCDLSIVIEAERIYENNKVCL